MSEALVNDVPVGFYGDPITNDLQAEEAIKVIRDAKEQVSIMAEWYKNALAQIKEQQENIIENEKARLRAYFETLPHKKTTTQESYALPSGKLILKKQEPEYKRNEDQLLEWTKANAPAYVKTKQTVDWDGLKKALSYMDEYAIDPNTGEVVPGITVVDRGSVFQIGK